MSGRLVGETYKLVLPKTDGEVLRAVCEQQLESRSSVRPGVAQLGWMLDMSESTVRRALARLVDAGLLKIVGYGKGGAGCATVYEIHLENGTPKPPRAKEERQNPVIAMTPFYKEGDKKTQSNQQQNPVIFDKNPVTAMTPHPVNRNLNRDDLKERGVVNPRATAPTPPPLRSVPKDFSSRKPGQLPNGHHANSPPVPKATNLPPDFQLTGEMERMARELAEANGVHLDVKMAFRKFMGHFTRGKGRETLLEDWEWRFETWIMDDIQKAPVVQAQANGKGANYAAHDESKRARAIKQRFREETGAELDEVSFR